MIKKNKKVYNILAIIPARGGSKGIKLKNLKKINGLSLVGHAIEKAKLSKYIDNIIVSTDHEKIKKEAERLKVKVPFLRPKKLSGDRVSDIDVLHDVLLKTEKFYSTKYHVIVMLQPTSPNRLINEIDDALLKLIHDTYNTIWSISSVDIKYHPLKIIQKKGNKITLFHNDGKNIIARQQLGKIYVRNGLFYIFKRKNIIDKALIDSNSYGYVINRDTANIDDISDLKKAKQIFINE